MQRTTLTSTIVNLTTSAMLVAALSSHACAQPDYVIMTVNRLPGGTFSWANDINTWRQVAGESNVYNGPGYGYSNRGIIWGAGGTVDIGSFGGGTSEACGINRNGEVVGYATTSLGDERACIYTGGQLLYVDATRESYANAINDHGDIVGAGRNGAFMDSYLWENRGNGPVTWIGSAYGISEALDINYNGVVVGWEEDQFRVQKAYRWENGQIQLLGTLGGATSVANAINQPGVIVGAAQTPNSGIFAHAFRWENGVMQDLGTFGGIASYARDVNNLGEIVGIATDNQGAYHPFIWIDGVMTNLEPHILNIAGWANVSPTAINDNGQIAGYGEYYGEWYGFVLQPQGLRLATPYPGKAAQSNDFVVTNATLMNDAIHFVYSLQSQVNGTAVPGCPGLYVDLVRPTVFGVAQTDVSGRATLTVNVPAAVSGLTVYFQAVEPSTCEVTNLVRYEFP